MAKKEKNKKSFFKGIGKELKQMKWPTGKEVIKYSLTTIGLSLFFIAFFILIDLLASFIKGMFI